MKKKKETTTNVLKIMFCVCSANIVYFLRGKRMKDNVQNREEEKKKMEKNV